MRQIAIKIIIILLSAITILLSFGLLMTGLQSLYYRINEMKYYLTGLWECETIFLCILTIFSALVLGWVAGSLVTRKQYYGGLRVFFIISSFIALAFTIFNLHHDIRTLIRGYYIRGDISLFLDGVYMCSLFVFFNRTLKPDEIRITKKLVTVTLPYLAIIFATLGFFSPFFLLYFLLSPKIEYWPSVYRDTLLWYYSSEIISIVIAGLLISRIRLPKVLQIIVLIMGLVPFGWAAYLLYEELFEIYDIYDFLVMLGCGIIILNLILFGFRVITSGTVSQKEHSCESRNPNDN